MKMIAMLRKAPAALQTLVYALHIMVYKKKIKLKVVYDSLTKLEVPQLKSKITLIFLHQVRFSFLNCFL